MLTQKGLLGGELWQRAHVLISQPHEDREFVGHNDNSMCYPEHRDVPEAQLHTDAGIGGVLPEPSSMDF